MPTSSSLVTNLPADFNTFGQAVDTSMSELLGGTTGQVLSKTSNTNMDFTWVTPTDQTPLTTKGDLFTFTTVDARLGVGANGTVLTADSAESSGLKWATPSGGGKVLQVIMGTTSSRATNSTTTYADTNLTATITPSSASSKVLVIVSQCGVNRTNGNSGNALLLQLQRGGSSIAQISNEGMATDTAIRNGDFTFNISYLDSPATTSATTYKTQFKNRVAAAAITVQEASELSTIILMEIGA